MFTRFNLIVGPASLVLLSLCFLPAQVRAQGMTEYILSTPPTGLAPGQGKRFLIFVQTGLPDPMRAQVKLYDERGAVIAQSSEATIPAVHFTLSTSTAAAFHWRAKRARAVFNFAHLATSR